MQVDAIDPTREPAWERFVREAPGATVFHSTRWASVLAETYGFTPRYLAVRNGSGGIVGGMPLIETRGRRLVGLPFSDQCAPLIADEPAAIALLTTAKSLVTRNDAASVELRGGSADLEAHGFHATAEQVNHVMPLDADLDELERRFHKSARHATRKARRDGVTVRHATAIEDMRCFYSLHTATRRKHGLLPQPWRFFEKIHEHFVGPGGGHLLMAEHEGVVIAAAVQLSYRDTLYSKFMASDMRFRHLNANNLLHYGELELGLSLGCRTLDLGRSDVAGKGLRAFKTSCGGIEQPLPYYHYPRPTNDALASSSSLPRRALALAVRFAPLWALRQAGALVYKYAA